jgi:hypothetical protein
MTDLEATLIDDSDTEELPDPKNFASGSKRWTLLHGVSRNSLKVLLENKKEREEERKPEDWYASEGDLTAYSTLLESNSQEPDVAKPVVVEEPFPANGKGGFAKRHKPKPNKPEPVPKDLEFMFARLTPEQVDKLWNMFTAFFVFQCFYVLSFPVLFYRFLPWKVAVATWGTFWVYLMIQNLYFLHDVVHISPFPPKPWQKFITHTWADFFGVCWEDLVLEHSRHHAGTPDLLVHGEFGWDPAEMLYKLQDYSWWTCPLVPFFHFMGTNDTGIGFMMYWYYYFPHDDAEEKCLRPAGQADVKRIHTRRIIGMLVQGSLWASVFLAGKFLMDGNGWTMLFVVNFFSRLGWSLGWTAFANINHSVTWNKFLAEGNDRKSPLAEAILTVILGGKARANEFYFHDMHHAFPNKVGSLSMRGRFNDAEDVYHGAMRIIEHGIFEHLAKEEEDLTLTAADVLPENQEQGKESKINMLQRRRSTVYKAELEAAGKTKEESIVQKVRKSFGARAVSDGSLSKPLLG